MLRVIPYIQFSSTMITAITGILKLYLLSNVLCLPVELLWQELIVQDLALIIQASIEAATLLAPHICLGYQCSANVSIRVQQRC